MTTGRTPDHRKGGRPRKTETDRRGEHLRVRVRPDELAAIEQRAAACNMALSDFVREQALSGAVLVRQFNTLSAVDRHDLARIGSNLNQIARACNATGDTARARNIHAHLEELRRFMDRLDADRQASNELGEG
jgi:uncharacterized protein (DUF1778 family)